MLKEFLIDIKYNIDGILTSLPTKMIVDKSNEDAQIIHFRIDLGDSCIVSEESEVTEIAITNLQKVLPPNVNIACCQSCRYGNFNPYGDCDNEIFCLKGMVPKDRKEICEIFFESL